MGVLKYLHTSSILGLLLELRAELPEDADECEPVLAVLRAGDTERSRTSCCCGNGCCTRGGDGRTGATNAGGTTEAADMAGMAPPMDCARAFADMERTRWAG